MMSAALETACNHNETAGTIEERLAQLLVELMPVLAGIDAARKDLVDTSPSSVGVARERRAVLTDLREALENFDASAKDIVDELQAAARETPAHAAIESLVACIDSFDFGGALDILQENEAAIAEISAAGTTLVD